MSAQLNKMSVHAVIQLQGRDEDGNPQYQWRAIGDQGHWLDVAQHGGLDELRQAFPYDNTEVCLMLAGTEVVTRRVEISATERKHLRKLVPFEVEEHITSELDSLHFALTKPEGDQVVAAYVDDGWLAQQINELEEIGLDVIHCYSEPLMLEREDNSWTLRFDDQLMVHYGNGLGFSVEASLAHVVLSNLIKTNPTPEKILLLGDDEQTLQQLWRLLPEALIEALTEDQISHQIVDRWNSLQTNRTADLELRQGSYARQLPLKRWWLEWRTVAIVGMVALAGYVAVNIGQIQMLKAQSADLIAQRTAVYRQVVPQGQAPDPERQLRTQLAQYETTTSSGTVIDMYARLAPLIAGNSDITLRSLRYSDQPGAMNLMLEASSYGNVLALQEAINNTGLQARLQNTSQQGDTQQARMVVSRGAQ